MKYWEIIANKLSEDGWSWGYCSCQNSKGQMLYLVDARRSDASRLIVQSDEMLSAFLELERAAQKALIAGDFT
jgi:hypothetical protein